MTNTTQTTLDSSQTVVLKPSYRLSIAIIGLGIGLFPLPYSPWPAILITIFGLFLFIQSCILRLQFTQTDLVVLQLGRELRRFPFSNWIAWRVILPGLPGLLYFREKASPHLLPILFDPEALKDQLRMRVGSLETPKEIKTNS